MLILDLFITRRSLYRLGVFAVQRLFDLCVHDFRIRIVVLLLS